jgi:hypothetical protein
MLAGEKKKPHREEVGRRHGHGEEAVARDDLAGRRGQERGSDGEGGRTVEDESIGDKRAGSSVREVGLWAGAGACKWKIKRPACIKSLPLIYSNSLMLYTTIGAASAPCS